MSKVEDVKGQMEIIANINKHVNGLKAKLDAMVDERRKANVIEDPAEQAKAYCDNVKSRFEGIREHADKLERIVDDNLWNLPKYRELLFIR